MAREQRSELIAFEGLRHAPENELGVVLLFGKIHRMLGFPEIEIVQPHFPDCWAVHRTAKGCRRVWIEFEFRSRSFKTHARRVRSLRPKRGFIVCWEHDWPDAGELADVIELKTAIGLGKRVWIQCAKPKYQWELDDVPRRHRRKYWFSVSARARPGDLLLLYRCGTRGLAKRHEVDETLLQSIANIYEITSFPEPHRKWKRGAYVRQLALLEEPLRLEHMRDDPYLKNAPWVKANLQGRPEVTTHWWRLRQLILQMNPELRSNKQFMDASQLSRRT